MQAIKQKYCWYIYLVYSTLVHPSVYSSVRLFVHWTPVRPSVRSLSVRLSFRLSVSSLRFGSLVFSETWHGVRDPYMCVTELGFLGKFSTGQKWPWNGPKWPKNRVWGLFKKITSLVLSGIRVKWKFLWFINILWKLHAWKKSVSQVKPKMAPGQWDFSIL